MAWSHNNWFLVAIVKYKLGDLIKIKFYFFFQNQSKFILG